MGEGTIGISDPQIGDGEGPIGVGHGSVTGEELIRIDDGRGQIGIGDGKGTD